MRKIRLLSCNATGTTFEEFEQEINDLADQGYFMLHFHDGIAVMQLKSESGERETYTRPRKTYRRSLTATIRRNL